MSKLALFTSSRFVAQSKQTNFFAIYETICNKSTKKHSIGDKMQSNLYPDLNGFEGWVDKKFDFQWIRSQMFS